MKYIVCEKNRTMCLQQTTNHIMHMMTQISKHLAVNPKQGSVTQNDCCYRRIQLLWGALLLCCVLHRILICSAIFPSRFLQDESVASIKGTLILTAQSTVSRKTEVQHDTPMPTFWVGPAKCAHCKSSCWLLWVQMMFIVTADPKNTLHATCEVGVDTAAPWSCQNTHSTCNRILLLRKNGSRRLLLS